GGTVAESDWDLYHYTGPETGPDLDLRPELQLLSLRPLAARVVSRLRQAHDTIHMTGVDWAMPLGGFTVRAAAAWRDERPSLRRPRLSLIGQFRNNDDFVLDARSSF